MVTATSLDQSSKKYEELEAQWRLRIEEGEWQPGDRLPTFAQLCDQHDVSRSTVERVCRALEQDGLIIRRQGSGTYVAQPRLRNSTGLIGYSGYGFRDTPSLSYWSHLQEGMREAAARENKGVLLLDNYTAYGWDRVDGALICDPIDEKDAARFEWIPSRLPRISVLCMAHGVPGVIADDYLGGQLAAKHLLELGHRRIACLMDAHRPMVNRRIAGYREVLMNRGIEPLAQWIRPYTAPDASSPDFAAHGAEVMQQWLRTDWHQLGCTAILVQNDLIAMGVMRALQETGISVPREVSVIGFDNIDICDYVSPRLTSVAVPLHELGLTAMELLLRQIENGRHTSATTMLPVRLQLRESTAPAAIT